ncbi:NDP-hexose 2,3-dehydratase family protein [Saccharopolyspora shandongensis]|uniref:NDP-hexose 2,3-dehydratase family protein n=1 Tax=Saccharopolyspora shandongensis TaxID=418495 RepID=UPI0034202310
MSASPGLDGSPDAGRRFLESALSASNRMIRTAEVHDWLAERLAVNRYDIARIPFRALDRWGFDPETGDLAHDSGRFFRVQGLRVTTNYGPVREWHQPIINQPEVGILGILVKEFDGVLHCLMAAKMEPGNINTIQLSPTVQATRSNYTRAHGGSTPRYLEHFTRQGRDRVLVDVLQSEQGAWFYHKRNRNMVVQTWEEVDVHPDFCWLTLGQVLELLGHDNLINMDTRTVLSCLPFPAPEFGADGPWRNALARSLDCRNGVRTMADALNWITDARTNYVLGTDRVPLDRLPRWTRTDREITHEEGKYFDIVAVSVAASNREVPGWTQPMVEPAAPGEIALLVKRIGGVLHALMRIRVEAGYRDTVELAPTVQCTAANYDDAPGAARPPFLAEVLAPAPESVRYSKILSEEGGRFYCAQNRYQIIEKPADFATDPPNDFEWLTLGQLVELVRHSNYLNIQARSLISSLHSLWVREP